MRSQDAIQKEKFEVLPAGYYNPKYDDIPRGVNWQYDLIALCCNKVKHKHRFLKLKLSKSKINITFIYIFIIVIEIALAVIIDNRGEVKVENGERILNDEATALKKSFEDLEFGVLYFNSLSSESIATLLEAISKADHSQLLMIALVFLSKGKTNELYDADGVAVPYEDVFDHFQGFSIPVIFFFDSASDDIKKNSTIDDTQNEKFNLPKKICPKNSLVLAASHNSASSPVVKEFTKKLSHTSVQECFEKICANNNNSTTVKSIWHDEAENNIFIVKSSNDR